MLLNTKSKLAPDKVIFRVIFCDSSPCLTIFSSLALSAQKKYYEPILGQVKVFSVKAFRVKLRPSVYNKASVFVYFNVHRAEMETPKKFSIRSFELLKNLRKVWQQSSVNPDLKKTNLIMFTKTKSHESKHQKINP